MILLFLSLERRDRQNGQTHYETDGEGENEEGSLYTGNVSK